MLLAPGNKPVRVAKFEVHTVGSEIHQELWALEEFNRHIDGTGLVLK
jgi:hypothetical protein